MTELEEKVVQIERKLTPEQMVVAFTKAESDAKKMIEEHKQQAGWTNWLTGSMMNVLGYSSQTEKDSDPKKKEEEMKQIMQKL